MLSDCLKLDVTEGLGLGKLAHSPLEFKPSINRLLSKHLAILAMSGAGKSYFVSVLLEELISRTKDQGRIAVIVVDKDGARIEPIKGGMATAIEKLGETVPEMMSRFAEKWGERKKQDA